MPFPAFLDANVLIPINLTDVLPRLADADTYRPLWSAQVLDEVERNLPKCARAISDRRRPPETLDSFLAQMTKTVPQFCQEAYRYSEQW